MSHGHDVDPAFVGPDTARAVAETMQALTSPTRVLILSRLAAGPCTVTQMATEIGVAQPAVSQQLRVLRHLGLVIGARQGRHTTYALHDDHVGELISQAIAHTEHLRLGLAAHPATDRTLISA